METAHYWREQAAIWRSMAERGEDGKLHAELRLLAEEAEAIAAEIDADTESAADICPGVSTRGSCG